MATKTLSNSIAVVLVLAALVVGVSARAQTSPEPAFPIAELGNCADRAACKAYCDSDTNKAACASYAQSHGLKRPAQAGEPNQSKLLEAIKADGGPGQCGKGASNPVQTCKTYCDDTTHIKTCVEYGKTHGLFSGEKLEKAEKIKTALESGVTLPVGCSDAKTCKEACQNPSTVAQASSCLAFAKAADILPPGFNEGAAKKVLSAIASSSAPFGSLKDFAKCKDATDPDIVKKCTEFAAQSGLITAQQAQRLQQTGGAGSGGRLMGTSTEKMMQRPAGLEGRAMQNASSSAPRQIQQGLPVGPGANLPAGDKRPNLEKRNATTTSFLGFVGQSAAAILSILFH